MQCMCGATDCPSCGTAQGYEVVRVWDSRLNRFVWRNPDEEEEEAEYGDDRDEDAEKEISK